MRAAMIAVVAPCRNQMAGIAQVWEELFVQLCILGSEFRTRSTLTASHRFVADIDTEFVQRIFQVSERKRKSNVHHNRQAMISGQL